MVIMEVVDGELIQQLLGHSKAEIVFRPWWDRVEDVLIYSLLMLGLVVAPTAMVLGSPLQCTLCKDDLCQQQRFSELVALDPGYCEDFVEEYCMVNGSVDSFLLYFPYILLVISLLMVGLEKTFIAVFRSTKRLEEFYNLLFNHHILGQDDISISSDKNKKVIVMEESLKTYKNIFFKSYLTRTIIELTVVSVLFLYLLFIGLPVIIFGNNILLCDVNGYLYACSGHPQEFYKVVLGITLVILLLYILTNIYNLNWILKPVRTQMSFIVCNFKNNRFNNKKKDKKYSIEDDYANDKDLKILIDLLALNQGIGAAISTYGLFFKV